jgi:hypothetical protein
MARTRHIHQRMSQRSIQLSMLDIVKDFGVDNGDKIILNKKSIDMAITELNRISKLMQKMRSRGGIVLVQENDVDITTYDLNSFDINLKH